MHPGGGGIKEAMANFKLNFLGLIKNNLKEGTRLAKCWPDTLKPRNLHVSSQPLGIPMVSFILTLRLLTIHLNLFIWTYTHEVRNVKINSFLANLNLPSITEEQQRSDDPITVNEINELNLKLANGKAPTYVYEVHLSY